MSVYVIAQLNIHDRTTYAKYGAGFMEIFSKYGGKVLSVDEVPTVLEGEWDFMRTVLLEFESEESANAWYHSQEYQELAQHRYAASRANIVLIKGPQV
jgi:uncharacterized protein (DUF1330 family)